MGSSRVFKGLDFPSEAKLRKTASLADPNRDLETDILRIVACTHATGARVSVKRLSTVLGVTTTALARAFERLVQEHLVRAEEDGLVGPLHQLRSAVILEEAHASGAAAMGDV